MRLLFVCMILCLNVKAQEWTNSNKHYTAGFLVGGTIASLNQLTPKQGVIIGVASATMLGFSKEVSDYANGNYFSKSDLFMTFAGSLLSSIAVYHIRNHYKKKSKTKVFFF